MRRTCLIYLTACAGICGCFSEASVESLATRVSHQPAKVASGPGTIAKGLQRVRPSASVVAPNQSRIRLRDVATELGVDHVYDNGWSKERLMVEATGGGGGWIDYDRDGWFDLYLVQAGNSGEPAGPRQPTDRLFRNVGGQRFLDVTLKAGIEEREYGQGVSVGDIDEDGFDDVYVSNAGPNTFFHNQGDGTFVEETLPRGLAGTLWSTSAAWADLDRDGDLDLYVCNYTKYDRLHPQVCRNSKGQKATCHPAHVEPVPDECYLNNGDGTFRAAARELGLFGPGNRGLGVAIADFTADGWPDVFVANDTTANFLFTNERGTHFTESAVVLGCAFNSEGLPQANMGVAVGDYDNNGCLDLAVTHFTREWTTLYQNLGAGGFRDVSAGTGLVSPTNTKLGFGAVMTDLDLNGSLELLQANGHIDDHKSLGIELEMAPQLFTFVKRPAPPGSPATYAAVDCGAQAGSYFQGTYIGRAIASADYDADGDVDVLFVHQNKPVAILRNDSHRGNWLQVELTGRVSNRRGVGATVTVHLPSGNQVQQMLGGSSYCAAHQPWLTFGLGDHAGLLSVDVLWPSGIRQSLRDVPSGQRLNLIEPEEPPVAEDHP